MRAAQVNNEITVLQKSRSEFYSEPFHKTVWLKDAEDMAREILKQLMLPNEYIELALQGLKKNSNAALTKFALSRGLICKATATAILNQNTKKKQPTKKQLSPEQARQRLRKDGITIKSFAEQHSLPYRTVQAVLNGTNKGRHGEAHKAAKALGLK